MDATRARAPRPLRWGYGGQFLFVVPDLQLVVVATSALTGQRNGRHNRAIHDLVDDLIAAVQPATSSNR